MDNKTPAIITATFGLEYLTMARNNRSSSTSSLHSAGGRPKRDILEHRNEIGPRFLIVMVGLPARGKSYISKKLARFLSWSGFNCKVFNVGNKRRLCGSEATPRSSMSAPAITTTLTTPERPEFAETLRMIPSSGVSNMSPHRPSSDPNSSPMQHDAAFFDPSNTEASNFREHLAMETLEDAMQWLKTRGGKVAILDATNSTIARRKRLLERVEQESGIKCFFIESICPDQRILDANIKMKLQGPDYKGMDPEKAIEDFKARIVNYEKVYETISEEEEQRFISYIKIVNVGQKVTSHLIKGYLPSQCVTYLMQIHIKPRTIWLTRHGESEFNLTNRIGGDAPLTEKGIEYSHALASFLQQIHPPSCSGSLGGDVFNNNYNTRRQSIDTYPVSPRPLSTNDEEEGDDKRAFYVGAFSSLKRRDRHVALSVYTSTLQRTMSIGDLFDSSQYDVHNVKMLNEIYAGSFEGMTYEQVEKDFPHEFEARLKNKLLYRYPGAGGESYLDVIERLRPLIVELERMEDDVVLVTHQAVMRTLLAYFAGISLVEMPSLVVPLHTAYCLMPKPYGVDIARHQYNFKTKEFDYMGEGEF